MHTDDTIHTPQISYNGTATGESLTGDDLYALLFDEDSPDTWFLQIVLRFLGELQATNDPRYDILKERARRLAFIQPQSLDRHIERIRRRDQQQTRIEMTLSQLLDTEFPPTRWVIPDRLPEGCTLLAGKKGMGKSMLVLNIALAVAVGGVALGKYAVDPGDVLYYALEDPPRRLQKRAQQMLPGLNAQGPLSRLTFRFSAPKIGDGLLEEVTTWLDNHSEASLVILDILARVRASRQRGTDVYQADYQTLEQLQDLAKGRGVNILVVTHARKADASDVFDTINASTGLLGAADTAMLLRRVRGQSDAILYVTGRDLEEDLELALQFDKSSALWSEVGGADGYRETKERIETLIAIGRLRIPFGPTDLMAELDLPYDTAQKRLVRLFHEGLLDRVQRGLYKRTASFMQALPPRMDVNETPSGNFAHGVSDCPKLIPEKSKDFDSFGQSDN